MTSNVSPSQLNLVVVLALLGLSATSDDARASTACSLLGLDILALTSWVWKWMNVALAALVHGGGRLLAHAQSC